MKRIGYGLLFVMIVMASYVNGVESKIHGSVKRISQLGRPLMRRAERTQANGVPLRSPQV